MKKRSAISMLTCGLGCIMFCGVPAGSAGESSAMKNVIVASKSGAFYGWPANNGAWTWEDGREILVGFSYGKFVEQEGHNTSEQKDLDGLARSLDGGVTWKIENPTAYIPDAVESSPPPGGIVFDAPGFGMRVKYGNFLVSRDRGRSWQGAYNFGTLTDTGELKDMRLTSRTGYIVTGRDSCLIFMSAQPRGKDYEDKSFVAETTDGGKTFRFISWIVPRDDPYRAVMPSPVRLADGTLAVALRRRIPQADDPTK